MLNTMDDLNNHLFAQLERLNDEEITGEKLEEELRRAEGVSNIAEQIIHNGELMFKTLKHAEEYGYSEGKLPGLLELR